ncbi:MAG: branched-chain-amino-acid transaminase [Candidatus Omnitrophota bacterium]|nr:branched-chain-amino-acid transaminase [Candidatus Omnitrophota bacterium]MDZ4241538.1 branched-chain-amino-acid transaminase [Candidatus Omnitrophota bacterium]
MKIYINGRFVDKEDAKVSVYDHGFLYGDGAFEGIRSYGRLVFKLKEHVDRLYETAHTLMIEIPLTRVQMAKAIVDTLKENKLDDAYIRVVVSRGEGDLGLDPRKCFGKPNTIIIADKITLYPAELYKKGLEIITVPTVRNHPEALNPRLKSLNYLNNILAKIEANNSGYLEAIMLDNHGFVAECTGDNIFMAKNGVLSTPSQGRLSGITRDAVLSLAAEHKIKTLETHITRHELYNADECFLTGTAAEIIPVVKIDGRLVGNGKPGALTLKLLQWFHTITRQDGIRY